MVEREREINREKRERKGGDIEKKREREIEREGERERERDGGGRRSMERIYRERFKAITTQYCSGPLTFLLL